MDTRTAGTTSGAAQHASGSMVRRILLGSQLRRLREARGVTREAAGWSIRASESKISRMELGRVGFKTRDVEDLLTLYGVTDPDEREPLLDLARDANKAGWWHSYSDVLPGWFQTYVGLESAASHINTYEVQYIHGLLQTEEYAHAVVTSGRNGLPAEEVERRVALRMERQRLLLAENPPQFLCVLDEPALRRPFGGPGVMDRQLRHLAELSERENITLRIFPLGAEPYSAESGAFTLLRFPESDLSDIVYIEQLTSALYLDKEEDVERYDGVLSRLVEYGHPAAGALDRLHEARRLV
jgi:transcriptional regulator with XRE-family HTH domain